MERILEPEDPDGGWVDTHHSDPTTAGIEEKVSEMTLDDCIVSVDAQFLSLIVLVFCPDLIIFLKNK